MDDDSATLDAQALLRFRELGPAAIDAVTERFYTTHGTVYAEFGPKGRQACRDDLAFHLEFLRPVLEFGLLQPMVDYLRWLATVLETRGIPAEHLALSLDWLAEFFASHMSGADAGVVATALARTKARFLLADDSPPAIYGHMPVPWDDSADFESALLAGDRRSAEALFDRHLKGHGLVDTELHLVQPALYSVGRRWQENQVSVAQEHLATAIAQSVMSSGLMKSPIPASNGKRVLLACVQGNHHSVGLLMVADAFQLAGWNVHYLGADVPTTSILQHLGVFKPHLLALSVSFAQQLPVVKEITARLNGLPPGDRPAVIIGGLAINQFDRLANRLGADAWGPDARAAVERAGSFMAASNP